jgi:hypothetical protein
MYDIDPEQGVQQSLLLLKHIELATNSALLPGGLEWFQLQSGIAQPILECPSLNVSISSWMVPVSRYFYVPSMQIHPEIGHVPKLLREHIAP